MLQVLQSCAPNPPEWIRRCLRSVQQWAQQHGHPHQYIEDQLFEFLPDELRSKCLPRHRLIATDIARLRWCEQALTEGADAVLWLDADTLMLDENWQPPEADYAVGREIWVQPKGTGWRSYKKVHNAALLFRRGNAFLPYYRHAAEQIVRAHQGRHMVPHLVGPKLLTALHNIAAHPVMEEAALLSPWTIQDWFAGTGPALETFLRDSVAAPALINLCQSSVANGELSDEQMLQAIGGRDSTTPMRILCAHNMRRHPLWK